MLYLLPRPESTPSFWFFDRKPGHTEFLPAQSNEFCDVIDRVVGLARIRWSLATPVTAAPPAHTLIFIFISIVPCLSLSMRCGGPRRRVARAHTSAPRCSQVLHQL